MVGVYRGAFSSCGTPGGLSGMTDWASAVGAVPAPTDTPMRSAIAARTAAATEGREELVM